MMGTKIFYINCLTLFFSLFVCSVIGRLFEMCSPQRLRPFFNLFLSPAMGLAFLILVTCLLGRFFPFSHTIAFDYFFIITLVVISIAIAPNKKQLIQYGGIVGVFGLLCGLPLLLELFFYGGYNAHNDAFTYLAISDWLQSHAFTQTITPQTITPAETQPALYQIMGYRMGAPYFLGFLQAMFHIKWSYTIYPTAVLMPVAVCCLAMGFPIFLSITQIVKRWIQLGLLILPALCFGALSFAMLYGFMPQIFGLALGSAALFWYGAILSYLKRPTFSRKKLIISTVPLAFFFSACAVAYSEISVFIILGILLSTIFFIIKNRVFTTYLMYGGGVAILSMTLINFELPRVIMALINQSNAVVGTSVNWSLLGYIFHMIGLHGGAWDIFQWSIDESILCKIIATMILVSLAIIFFWNRKRIKASILQGTWLPFALVLCTFIIGIIYFRYFVANPFPVGQGQSWSQFKLSEWAFPFASVFILSNIIILCRHSSRILKSVVILLLLLACYFVASSVKYRMELTAKYYVGVKNLDQFYQDARKIILDTCQKKLPIYLNLSNENYKFRQMLTLYLTDRQIKSDWTGDNYIEHRLPKNKKVEFLQLGDCLVQPFGNKVGLTGTTLNILNVSILDSNETVQLRPITKTNGQEYDNQGNTWYWVESSIKFKPIFLLNPKIYEKEFAHTLLKFQYRTRASENLFIRIKTKSENIIVFKIHSNDSKGKNYTFQKTLNLSASQITELEIHADGIATPLGKNDARKASWMLRNLTMTPER